MVEDRYDSGCDRLSGIMAVRVALRLGAVPAASSKRNEEGQYPCDAPLAQTWPHSVCGLFTLRRAHNITGPEERIRHIRLLTSWHCRYNKHWDRLSFPHR